MIGLNHIDCQTSQQCNIFTKDEEEDNKDDDDDDGGESIPHRPKIRKTARAAISRIKMLDASEEEEEEDEGSRRSSRNQGSRSSKRTAVFHRNSKENVVYSVLRGRRKMRRRMRSQAPRQASPAQPLRANLSD